MAVTPGAQLLLLLAVLGGCTVTAAATPAGTNLKACLTALNASRAVFPGDPTYAAASSTFNIRINSTPAAIYFANNASDAAAAVQCAAAAGVKVSPAAGRQSFQGWTVMTDYLVVDVTNMTQVTLSADNKRVTVGAGNNGVMVQTAVNKTGIKGAIVPGGYCSYVGVAGWTLGGGFGLLGRYLGLGCDQVVSYEIVLANGTIVKANATNNTDLFWASCGSGGGSFGIVTAFEYKLSILPNEGRVTAFSIKYGPGDASVQAYLDFQDALPTLDPRYGMTFSLSGGFGLTGLFFGTPAELVVGLEAAGLLENLDPDSPNPDSPVAAKYPSGFGFEEFASYWDAVATVVPTWSGPAFNQSVPWGSSFTGSATDVEWVLSAMNGVAPAGHVVGGQDYNTWHASQSRLVGNLSRDAVEALVSFAGGRTAECIASGGTSLSCLFGLSGHVLGGAYWARPANATAFPHRDMYAIMDAVVQVPSSVFAQFAKDIPPIATAILDGFLSTIQPFLPKPEAAYVNYLLPSMDDYQSGYWGSNYPRLQAIKAQVDPTGLFNKPYTIQAGTNGTVPVANGTVPVANVTAAAGTNGTVPGANGTAAAGTNKPATGTNGAGRGAAVHLAAAVLAAVGAAVLLV